MKKTLSSKMKRILSTVSQASKSKTFMLLGLFALCLAPQVLQAQVSGEVFRDYNASGIRELANGEKGIIGAVISAYNKAGSLVGRDTVRKSDGKYLIPSVSGKLRIEFTNLGDAIYDSPASPSNGTSVQFVAAPITAVNLGINRPADFLSNKAKVLTTCFVAGAHTNPDPVLITFPYYGSGSTRTDGYDIGYDTPLNHELAVPASKMGAVWGLCYDRFDAKIYASAFMKRHADYGPAGSGAIYIADTVGVDAQKLMSIDDVFGAGATGPNLHIMTDHFRDYTEQGSLSTLNIIGKTSIGGLAISPDSKFLYAMNLWDRKLYVIPSKGPWSTSNIKRIDVPIPAGTKNPDDIRPFGVEQYLGKVYVGMVNSAESTQDSTDLHAYIYLFDIKTLKFDTKPVFDFPLNYQRGRATPGAPQQIAAWKPWAKNFAAIPPNVGDFNWQYPVYPQAMLGGLVFDDNGDLIISLKDRYGDQMGNFVRSNPANEQYYAGVTVGDMLKASKNKDGSFTLEKNGVAGAYTGSGVGNGTGPGGGEFFGEDYYAPFQNEITGGSVKVLPGTGQVVAACIDPIFVPNSAYQGALSGGIRWFDTETGKFTRGYRFYGPGLGGKDASLDGPHSDFGKSSGVGDMEFISAPGPNEIGNRVWNDYNGNGIQDAHEAGIKGLNVELWKAGVKIATEVTDDQGQYIFNSDKYVELTRFLDYEIRVDTTQAALAGLHLTKKDAGINDIIDNDAVRSGKYAVIFYKTGNYAENDHTLDFGFNVCPTVQINTQAVCIGGTANFSLTTDIATIFSWTGPAGFVSSDKNPSIKNIASSNDGIYSVTAMNALECPATATISLSTFVIPSAVVAIAQGVTCREDGTTNNDGKITLSGFGSTDRYIYNIGDTYTGAAIYATATAIPSTGIILDGLLNPAISQSYAIRIFNSSGCFVDRTVTLSHASCTAAVVDVSLKKTVSAGPYTVGQNITYTITVNNAGPAAATNVVIKDVLPESLSFVSSADFQNNAGTLTSRIITSVGVGSSVQLTLVAQIKAGGSILNCAEITQTTQRDTDSTPNNGIYDTEDDHDCVSLTVPITICQGGKYTINIPLNYTSVKWFRNGTEITAATPATVAVINSNGSLTVATDGDYTFTTTLVGACPSTGCSPVKIIMASIVVPTISQIPVCVGGSLNLSASAANTYSWAGPVGFTSNIQNPVLVSASTVMNGTYSLTVTAGANQCTGTATTVVAINTATITASSNSSVCVGATLQLSIAEAGTYSWVGPTFSSTLKNPVRTNATTAMSGVYSATITNTNGCTASTTISVVVNTLTATPTANSPVCVGGSINLNLPESGVYTWAGPAGFVSSIKSPIIANVTTAMSGIYSVSVSGNNTCTASATVSVQVNKMTATASNNSPVCVGKLLSLNVIEDGIYAWSGPNGFNSTAQNPILASASLNMVGIYTVTVTGKNGCIATATTSVVVNTITATPRANTPVCIGSTLNLSVAEQGTYTWSGPLSFGSNIQNPSRSSASTAMTGIYSVTVQGINGCIASNTVSIVVNTITALPSASPNPACVGGSLRLGVAEDGTYSWVGPGGFTSNSQNPIRTNVATNMAGIYSVTVFGNNTCTASATVSVAVNSQNITASTTPVCEGGTINLRVVEEGLYNWAGPLGFASTEQTPARPNATINRGGAYSVTLTGLTGCTASTIVNVNILTTSVAIGSNSPICAGNPLTISTSQQGIYNWTGPTGFISTAQNVMRNPATIDMAGIYQLNYTASNGCTASNSINMVVNTHVAVPTSNSPVCIGSTITLSVNDSESYTWSGPAGFVATNQMPNRTNAAVVMAGVYSVTTRAANGCTASNTINIVVNTQGATATANTPLCVGQILQLNASDGGSQYAWNGPANFGSGLQNPTRSGASVSMSGIYSVTVQGINRCTGTATVAVVVKPLPEFLLTTTNASCTGYEVASNGKIMITGVLNGDRVGFSVGNGYTGPSYADARSIPTDGILSATIPNPAIPTTYTIRVYNTDNGCYADKQVTINPVACQFGSIGNYVWKDKNKNGIQDADENGLQGIKVILLASNNSILDSTVTDISGYYLFDRLLTGNYRVKFVLPYKCIFTVSNAGTDDAKDSDAGTDGLSPIVSINTALNPQDIGRNNGTIDGGFITACEKPSISAELNQEICSDGLLKPFKMTENQPTQGIVQWFTFANNDYTVGNPITTAKGTTFMPTAAQLPPADSRKYYFAVVKMSEIDATCSDTAWVTLKINPKPVLLVSANKTKICSGETAKIRGFADGSTIQWYLNATGTQSVQTTTHTQEWTVSPINTTTYYAEAITPAGCVSTREPVTIEVNAKPSTPTCSGGTNICPLLTVDLTTLKISPISIPGGTFEWHTGSDLSSPIVANPKTVGGGNYYLFEKSSTGCYSDPALVSINIIKCDCKNPLRVEAGLDQYITAGDTIKLSAKLYGATKAVWSTDGSGYFGDVNNLRTYYIPSEADKDKSKVTLSIKTIDDDPNDNCEPTMDALIVSIRPLDPPSISCGKTALCYGESATLVSLGCKGIVVWSTGQIGAYITISPNVTSSYTAKCRVNYCDSKPSDPLKITVFRADTPSVTASNQNICNGESVSLTANGCNGAVIWSDGQMGNTIIVKPSETTNYTAFCREGYCDSKDSFPMKISVTAPAKPEIYCVKSEMCEGEKLTLFAKNCGNGILYWSNGMVGSGILIAPTQTTTFTVVCKVQECSSVPSDKWVMTVKRLKAPVINANKNQTCGGENLILSSLGCEGAVVWSNGMTGNNIIANITDNATFTAYCQQGDCKSDDSLPLTIEVVKPTTPEIVCDKPEICVNELVTISAQGCNGLVSWSSGQTGNSITVALSKATSFTAVCRIGDCQSTASNTKIINVLPVPVVPTISATASDVCPNEAVTISAIGCSGNIEWSSGEKTQSINVTPATTTTYTAECVSGKCRSGKSKDFILTVGKPVVPSIKASTTNICIGQSITLSAIGCVAGVEWSNGKTGAEISVTPDVSTAYTAACVSISGKCKSENSLNITITVNKVTPPILTCSKDAVCPGEELTLSAANCNGTVQWSNGMIGNSIKVQPIITTSYTATCKSGACLSGTSNILSIAVAPTPVKPQVTTTELVNNCPITTVSLKMALVSNPTTTTSVFEYHLSDFPTSPTVQNIEAVTASGTYYVFERSAAGCYSEPSPIKVNLVACPACWTNPTTADAGPDASICAGQPYQLSGKIGGAATVAKWISSGNGTFSNPTLANTTYTPSAEDLVQGTVTLTLATDDPDGTTGGCKAATDNMKLTVNGIPTTPIIKIDGNNNLCSGDSVRLMAMNAGYKYLWSNGETVSIIWVKRSGTYSLKLTDSYLCSRESDKITVAVADPIAAAQTIDLTNTLPILTVDLATGLKSQPKTVGGVFEYHTGNLPTSPKVATPATVTDGTYYVFERSILGCYSGAAKIVVKITLPKADLSLVKIADKAQIEQGKEVVFTFRVKNAGPQIANNVEITDVLPQGLEFVSGPGIININGTLKVSFSKVAVNDSVSVSFIAKVTKTGSIVNKAEITKADEEDPDSKPNTGVNDGQDDIGIASITGLIPPKAQIGIAKYLADVGKLNGSYDVKYKFVVKNLGNTPLNMVEVTDSLLNTFPSYVTFYIKQAPTANKNSLLKLNPAYNGKTDNRIVIADVNSLLAVGKADTITFTVNAVCSTQDAPFMNWAYATAESGVLKTSDKSNNGVNPDPNGNGNPNDDDENAGTPLTLIGPSIQGDLFIPEGFSPNGDGINDAFVIRNTDGETSINLKIYDIWGSLVYQNDHYQNDWAGIANAGTAYNQGIGLPDGTYYYVVWLSDGRVFVRFFTIMR